jgi:hypothetical protein
MNAVLAAGTALTQARGDGFDREVKAPLPLWGGEAIGNRHDRPSDAAGVSGLQCMPRTQDPFPVEGVAQWTNSQH